MNFHKQYLQQGYLSPVVIIDSDETAWHRAQLGHTEQQIGKLHYRSKIHTVMTSTAVLASLKKVLDVVEQLIGPDILVYNVTSIIKEANTETHVTWHQDLTYWA